MSAGEVPAIAPGDLEPEPQKMWLVVTASAAGTAFEWYDFFVFVPLAGIIAKTFASGLSETASYAFALCTFAVGFAFRPVGALLFGRIGDRAGRKGTFLITISLMGLATFAIGLLPSYQQAGIIAPIAFVLLRLSQGLALGGEWGGAAIYIAEHTTPKRRGYLTSWLGASAAFGLGGALAVVLATRTIMGEPAFNAWGWRVPFLLSAVLLAISIGIRLMLNESPVFKRMHADGARSEKPYVEAFLQWRHLKLVLTALGSMMIAQGAIWYCAFFYAQFFIERVLKVEPTIVNEIMISMTVISAPLYIFFGWLSDRLGRRLVMGSGVALVTLALIPGFHQITQAANPELAAAISRAPVVVYADPARCSFQFDPIGKTEFKSDCDIAKSFLSGAGVSYTNAAAPAGAPTTVKVGSAVVASVDARNLVGPAVKAAKADVSARLRMALKAAGYPEKAPPQKTDSLGVLAVLALFTLGATALYGPQAAALVELFPARIRYTALSLPYHIGTGWVGGFLPATAYAMVVSSGDIYFGLWYPVVIGCLSLVCFLLFLPETKGRDLHV